MHASIRALLPVAALLSVAVFAQESEREMTCDESWHNDDLVSHCEINEMKLAAMPHVDVDGGVNGGMTVKGWTQNAVLVRARVETAAETDGEAKAIARQIVIHTGGGRVIADGPQHSHHTNWSVSYEIFVPQNTDLNLKAHNGGIRIADIRGNIEFEALNGGVSLKRLAGNVHGHTTNGGLSVELAGERWEGGQLDASTTNGGVSMAVPSGYSAHLETGTVNGHINVDFPVTVRGQIDRKLSIDLGSGGPLVRAVTTNGGVSIRRKAT
jgi:putative adhesin